jgi:signal transduction histidine kinase
MFDHNPLAAVLAFSALGANFIGAALLVLFNPRNLAVRWYGGFALTQLVWLALQGTLLLFQLPAFWWTVFAIDVHIMPAFFCGSAIVEWRGGRGGWLPALPLAAAVLLLPLMLPNPLGSPLTVPWHALAWGVPAVLYFRGRRAPLPTGGGRVLIVVLTVMVPVGVVGAIALGGAFVLYLLPLMTIVIQLLVFMGVVYHRYYDIEVRAARTGELAASAAELDRLALLGELAATVAHEVRNPLTGIRSLTQRIAEGPLPEDKRQRYAEVILGEVERLDRMVGNLTGLARRTTGNGGASQPTDIAALFDDLALLLEARTRRAGVRLITSGNGSIDAPREALAQALLNLLLNAIAQTPAGGEVELRAEHDTIRVRDQGPGVPAERRQSIFEPFQTSGSGTGLGLAVVRRLATAHGWDISVGDSPQGGAEFVIRVRQ